MSLTAQRLGQIREVMAQQNLDAFVLSTFDEYLNEYVPERNKRLQWLTGFTGSAGAAVILRDSAAMFVDGRYTVQVRQQVDAEQFAYHHLIEEPYAQWLSEQLSAGQRVGLDSRMFNLDTYETLETTLSKRDIALVPLNEHPVDAVWQDRPEESIRTGMVLPETYTGVSSAEKRQQIAQQLSTQNVDAALIFAPDSVAWLLNIRGHDIPATPVILGYALLTSDGSVTWFTNPEKLPEGFYEHVGTGVTVVNEADAAAHLAAFNGRRVLADPKTANAWAQLTLKEQGAELVAGNDPVLIPKACKNPTEQEGMRQAHIRDGVAEVKFLCWLDRSVASGAELNEAALADQLYRFRAEQDKFQEVSFDTISAAGSNAAMCHYNHMNGTPAELPEHGVYLVDSGGQYLDGTTDITRTVAIGEPDAEIREQFTRVLKGYIALETARFPHGTTGTQLDILARQYLWQEGYDFDHGTGHGVGAFLSVHEGPQRISKALNPIALQPGMVVSNEPGFYKADAYGIRCENLIMVKEAQNLPGNVPMLEFEVLTLAPFDLRLVDEKLLTDGEIQWLNAYHQRVYDTLVDRLDESERPWLEQATRSL
ncbi:aminopeptidase P family protein [Reinekea blandensis]|uniref:Aminopeptidase P, putative n=1 Tax=Reinekea blandensis MED297 TaxID=314283 RepID=A4BGR3_9GAMM|nr:aminopeptidase P family protein [Reinekea blandensis]EAR08711.1 aminopeptidase P, putative [Reinekea sp. MED297] [Reinekea blandensis MED297]